MELFWQYKLHYGSWTEVYLRRKQFNGSCKEMERNLFQRENCVFAIRNTQVKWYFWYLATLMIGFLIHQGSKCDKNSWVPHQVNTLWCLPAILNHWCQKLNLPIQHDQNLVELIGISLLGLSWKRYSRVKNSDKG